MKQLSRSSLNESSFRQTSEPHEKMKVINSKETGPISNRLKSAIIGVKSPVSKPSRKISDKLSAPSAPNVSNNRNSSTSALKHSRLSTPSSRTCPEFEDEFFVENNIFPSSRKSFSDNSNISLNNCSSRDVNVSHINRPESNLEYDLSSEDLHNPELLTNVHSPQDFNSPTHKDEIILNKELITVEEKSSIKPISSSEHVIRDETNNVNSNIKEFLNPKPLARGSGRSKSLRIPSLNAVPSSDDKHLGIKNPDFKEHPVKASRSASIRVANTDGKLTSSVQKQKQVQSVSRHKSMTGSSLTQFVNEDGMSESQFSFGTRNVTSKHTNQSSHQAESFKVSSTQSHHKSTKPVSTNLHFLSPTSASKYGSFNFKSPEHINCLPTAIDNTLVSRSNFLKFSLVDRFGKDPHPTRRHVSMSQRPTGSKKSIGGKVDDTPEKQHPSPCAESDVDLSHLSIRASDFLEEEAYDGNSTSQLKVEELEVVCNDLSSQTVEQNSPVTTEESFLDFSMSESSKMRRSTIIPLRLKEDTESVHLHHVDDSEIIQFIAPAPDAVVEEYTHSLRHHVEREALKNDTHKESPASEKPYLSFIKTLRHVGSHDDMKEEASIKPKSISSLEIQYETKLKSSPLSSKSVSGSVKSLVKMFEYSKESV